MLFFFVFSLPSSLSLSLSLFLSRKKIIFPFLLKAHLGKQTLKDAKLRSRER